MPEMPEVQGLVDFLGERAVGHAITRTSVGEIAALKTYDPPNTALHGATITATARYGKFVDIACGDDLHLVFHLAKAGWLRWYDTLPTTLIKPGRSPIALRIALDDGSGFDLTEAGTKKSLAVYLVRIMRQHDRRFDRTAVNTVTQLFFVEQPVRYAEARPRGGDREHAMARAHILRHHHHRGAVAAVA